MNTPEPEPMSHEKETGTSRRRSLHLGIAPKRRDKAFFLGVLLKAYSAL